MTIRTARATLVALVATIAALMVGRAPAAAEAVPTFQWSASAAAPQAHWKAVAAGNGLFVAVAPDGESRVVTSADGVTWTPQTAPQRRWLYVAFGAGRFVAMAGSWSDLYSSPGLPADDPEDHGVMWSADGVTWTLAQLGASSSVAWKALTYADGRFVAIGELGRTVISTDGETWRSGSLGDNVASIEGVTFGPDGYLAISWLGAVYTSKDGLAWTARGSLPAETIWLSLAYGNGRYIAMSAFGETSISTDGLRWTPAIWSSGLREIRYENGLFVGAGFYEVATSMDGTRWTTQSTRDLSAGRMNGAAYQRGLVVGVGEVDPRSHGGLGGFHDTPLPFAMVRGLRSCVEGAPSDLAATVLGTAVTFGWQGCGPAGFVLESGSVSGASDLAKIDLAANTNEWVVRNIAPGTFYIRVRELEKRRVSNEVKVVIGQTPPAVETREADWVGDTSARLLAAVNGLGGASTASFAISTDSAFGSAQVVQVPGTTKGEGVVSATATGLRPDTTYYVRASATNSGGTTRGEVRTFRTTKTPIEPPKPNAPLVEAKPDLTATTPSALGTPPEETADGGGGEMSSEGW
ncbi:MAG: fibronectin type III domain-containing protein [Chloroflexota bacterium]